jgi:iron complex transport system substrate-binding protein
VRARVVFALAALLLGAAAPARIVSLNPCLDAILVRVADPGQIAALSHFARDPSQSSIANLALAYPYTYETAEEVVAIRPDLVLATSHTAPDTRAALKRLQIRLVTFGVPQTIAESLDQVRLVAAAAGHPDRGDALAARIEAALSAASPPPGAKPDTALLLGPGGLTAGTGTLIDEVLRRTGFLNMASRYGIAAWGKASLEDILADPPQVLLTGHGAYPSWSERWLSSPALARVPQANFPPTLLYCAGPTLIDAATALRAAHEK